jgi:hypothetical protein
MWRIINVLLQGDSQSAGPGVRIREIPEGSADGGWFSSAPRDLERRR